jgi:tetratricopeptide (TPR) repeat protein
MNRLLRTAALAALLAISSLVSPPYAHGQAAKPTRLIDQPAYDVLTLDKSNDSKVLKVYPVSLPGRKLPEKPKSTDKLKVKLLDDGVEYEVNWQHIEKLEFFEQLVLAEANQLTAAGKFDEAYDDFAFLLNLYPQLPGLNESRQSYLYLAAGAAFRQQKYDEALAVLEELLKHNPNYRAGETSPTLLQVLGNIADRIITAYVEQQDYRAARVLLARLSQQYKAENEPFAQRARQQLSDLAARRLEEAKTHLAAGRFVEAHDAAGSMKLIWPDLPGAAEIAAEIARRHPLIAVGVEHPALSFDTLSLQNISARRAGRLTERLLVEMTGLGPEGGKYVSPYGAVSRSDDGLALIFRLPAGPGNSTAAYDLAQRLLSRAQPGSPEYQPTWGRIVAAVRSSGTNEVQVDLRLPHVLPEALVQVPLGVSTAAGPSRMTPFTLLSRDERQTRLVANEQYLFKGAAQPAEIVERHFADPQRALIALRRGEIDLLDRVFPGDIAALASDASLVVAPYRAPTTHVLAIRSEHPFLANRNFRRALVYGCNREQLLLQGLLRDRPRPGFRTISAPFPAPFGDLPAYGYDSQIEPRAFDQRLALTLRIVADGEIKSASEKQMLPVPKLTPLVLGHPADETSRIACRGLAKQWKQIGVECSLVEFPPGVFDDPAAADATKKCDLVYLQLATWEPLVDAGRLLATGGVAPAASGVIQLTLREIEQARNWQQARERLLHLHRLVHEDVALIPLWQTLDHFAYRRSLAGITADRLRLYQDVEQWHSTAQLAGTQP